MHPSDGSVQSKPVLRLRRSLARRRRVERAFRFCGLAAILGVFGFIAVLLVSIGARGLGGFVHSYVLLSVEVESSPPDGAYRSAIQQALFATFPHYETPAQRRELLRLLSDGAEYVLRDEIMDQGFPVRVSLWLPLDSSVHAALASEEYSGLSEIQAAALSELKQRDRTSQRFNWAFITSGDSRDAELAGIGGAVLGSMLSLLVTLALAFPIGVATAVYLEEFASRNALTDFIEINVNNLAAVPTIIFGLLGLVVFVNGFGLPRSVPLVAGLVLALMTLPTIVIASRAALRSVPQAIRDASLALGASKMQTVLHHVLPPALPGIITGTIIALAQALGATAPLLMIGMVAFIVDVPAALNDPATTLPVQIYLWADNPERAFVAKTAAAVLVLLGLLAILNLGATWMRHKLEQRW